MNPQTFTITRNNKYDWKANALNRAEFFVTVVAPWYFTKRLPYECLYLKYVLKYRRFPDLS